MTGVDETVHTPNQAPMLNARNEEEEFANIYLRKITAEIGDDLDKVREANDFTARSLPILIHALKQGQSIFSPEEKKRVIGAATG